MSSDRQDDLARQFDRLDRHLPDRAARALRWLRQPRLVWLRVPMSGLLLVGGVFSFLPILGVWMIPLGLMLLAQDIPFLRPPLARALGWIEDKWEARRRAAAPRAK
jgi:hypothetical protein